MRSTGINRAIGGDDGFFTGGTGLRIAVFHADDALVAALVQVAKHVGVVDFAGARFVAAGIVANLEVGRFVPAAVDVADEVPLADLLVIDVEEDFA